MLVGAWWHHYRKPCIYPSLITISYHSKLSNLGFDLLKYGIVSQLDALPY